MKTIIYILLALCCIGICNIIISCNNMNASNGIKEYQTGLKKEKRIGDMIFRLSYCPITQLAEKEMESAKTQQEKDSILNSYKGSKYFIYEIAAEAEKEGKATDYGAYNLQEYLKRSEDFSFKMGEDLMLVVEKDTLYPSIYHHEKGYELAHSQKFMIAFPYHQNFDNDEVTFIHNDVHFQLGMIKLKMILHE